MKSFIQHLKEFAQRSTSDYVFDTHSVSSSSLSIPISGPMFKRIWPDTIRTTVFHVLSAEDIYALKKLEGGKKTISAFFSMMSRYLESGIAGGGGVIAELEADVIVSARDDIMSQVDKMGRRWVEVSWFENQTRGGTGPGFGKFEKDLNTLIKGLVVKHLGPIMGQTETRAANPFELWIMMKSHLKAGREGGGKRLSLVIKDYFDGVEKIIKDNKEVMGNIFYGYAKSKRMTDNAWDEQIVNNFKVKKVHVLKDLFDNEEALSDLTSAYPKPAMVKSWDSFMDIEIYTRAVVKKEIGR